MAIAHTVLEVTEMGNGFILERGTWTFAAGAVTSGNITAQAPTYTAGTVSVPGIANIIAWSFASDGDYAVMPAMDVQPNIIKITGTASDTGTYTIIGKAC